MAFHRRYQHHHFGGTANYFAMLITMFLCITTTTATLAFVFSKDASVAHGGSNSCFMTPSPCHRRSTSVSTATENRRSFSCSATGSALSSSSSSSSSSADKEKEEKQMFKHTLAILTVPRSSSDRVANEAILETAMAHTVKTPDARLSVVLRGTAGSRDDGFTTNELPPPTLSQLRVNVGEIYSSAWDISMAGDEKDEGRLVAPTILTDIVVYPQNLPNAAPESWVHIRPDLDCVCSHESIIGWVSTGAAGTGEDHRNVSGEGSGGLDSHVAAINDERKSRGLSKVHALHVPHWPLGADVKDEPNIVFLEDEMTQQQWEQQQQSSKQQNARDGGLIGGVRVHNDNLYDSVAVGGTFDGMHYGHRKLLTLAVSSVRPITGKLLVGVTNDEMLKSKTFSSLIPPLKERMTSVRSFIDALAPGMKDRMKIVPIDDAFGPPGAPGEDNDFDALMLSHETLETGYSLNRHREEVLGMKPLKLLCTRRTEPHGMSSTALRRARSGE